MLACFAFLKIYGDFALPFFTIPITSFPIAARRPIPARKESRLVQIDALYRIIQFFGQTIGMLVVDAFCTETDAACL
jgi:hypothetical protein